MNDNVPEMFRNRHTKAYLDELGTLPDDWDSYEGKTPTEAARAAAWRFVQSIVNGRFQFTPCLDGGIQIDTWGGDELAWGPDGEQEFD